MGGGHCGTAAAWRFAVNRLLVLGVYDIGEFAGGENICGSFNWRRLFDPFDPTATYRDAGD
jgi:hypothetical protein